MATLMHPAEKSMPWVASSFMTNRSNAGVALHCLHYLRAHFSHITNHNNLPFPFWTGICPNEWHLAHCAIPLQLCPNHASRAKPLSPCILVWIRKAFKCFYIFLDSASVCSTWSQFIDEMKTLEYKNVAMLENPVADVVPTEANQG